jgi:GT2 family glycosyltransferase
MPIIGLLGKSVLNSVNLFLQNTRIRKNMGVQGMREDEQGSTAVNVSPGTSVIICSRNRPQLLQRLVASVLEGNTLHNEVIIVDDSDVVHSELASLSAPGKCELRYLWTRSIGLSRANNDGIKAARYDILVFTQDDVVVTPTWFETIVTTLRDAPSRTVVTGRVIPGEAEIGGGFSPSTTTETQEVMYKGRIGEDVLYLQNAAFHRSTLEEIGLFDERIGPGTEFPGAEDNDFGLRLLEAGYAILHAHDAVVIHRAWRGSAEYASLQWNYGRAQGAFYAKYLSLNDSYMLKRMIYDILRSCARIPLRAWRQRRLSCGEFKYLLGLFVGAIRWARLYG